MLWTWNGCKCLAKGNQRPKYLFSCNQVRTVAAGMPNTPAVTSKSPLAKAECRQKYITPVLCFLVLTMCFFLPSLEAKLWFVDFVPKFSLNIQQQNFHSNFNPGRNLNGFIYVISCARHGANAKLKTGSCWKRGDNHIHILITCWLTCSTSAHGGKRVTKSGLSVAACFLCYGFLCFLYYFVCFWLLLQLCNPLSIARISW